MIDKQWDMRPNIPRALMLAQREVAVFVQDAVMLEGINFTLPEIQTILDGISVGGHKLSDQQIAVNQGKAWGFIFDSIRKEKFNLSSDFACELHEIAGKEEALTWGKFRDGSVTIAGTDYMPPSFNSLKEEYASMIDRSAKYEDVYDQAISIFLDMARNQFFYDANKRMGRFMMNGHLLNNGYPAINLPASKQLEFNQLMLNFYESGEKTPMNHFMRSCLDERAVKIMREGDVGLKP
ncbi:MAG: Fic family protein [Halomonas sp.]|nr:Fic family protein [Halomonas sp.]